MDFNKYDIQDVWEQKPVEDMMLLHFRMGDFYYKLIIFIRNNRYEPGNVIHGNQTFERSCPVCDSRYNICDLLVPHKEAFFYYLIQRPEIRLRWVTRAPSLFLHLNERRGNQHGIEHV